MTASFTSVKESQIQSEHSKKYLCSECRTLPLNKTKNLRPEGWFLEECAHYVCKSCLKASRPTHTECDNCRSIIQNSSNGGFIGIDQPTKKVILNSKISCPNKSEGCSAVFSVCELAAHQPQCVYEEKLINANLKQNIPISGDQLSTVVALAQIQDQRYMSALSLPGGRASEPAQPTLQLTGSSGSSDSHKSGSGDSGNGSDQDKQNAPAPTDGVGMDYDDTQQSTSGGGDRRTVSTVSRRTNRTESNSRSKVEQWNMDASLDATGRLVFPCMYQPWGCPYRSASRDQMTNHENTNAAEHLKLSTNTSLSQKQAFERYLLRLTLNGRASSSDKGASTVTLSDDMKSSITKSRGKAPMSLTRNTVSVSSIEDSNSMSLDVPALRSMDSVDTIRQGDRVATLNLSLASQFQTFLTGLLSIPRENSSIQEYIKEPRYFVTIGTVVLKVDQLTGRKSAAQRAGRGKVESYILSPPLLTHVQGYRFCFKLFLHGDGKARGKFISIFYTILNGPFDAILPWPFNRRIRTEVLPQHPNRNGEPVIVKTIQPNDLPSFARPADNKPNVASGSPQFMDLKRLTEPYLVNDTLFIRMSTFEPRL